mmetsp:Transcript_35936/g.111254  ORF Transcript_35936/g.111254 Transcript_35936/m.111254 type:complete len:177 (-) Transcript_35936:405-935(-)
MTVTPAIAKARIATREEEIRRLERELATARAAVLSDRRELAALETPSAATGMAFRETTSRSLVKAFGWRVTAGIVTFCSSMYFTNNLRTALAIVASDFLSKSGTMRVRPRPEAEFPDASETEGILRDDGRSASRGFARRDVARRRRAGSSASGSSTRSRWAGRRTARASRGPSPRR